MSRNSTGPRSRRGTVPIVVALTLFMLLGFIALAVDISWLVSVSAELQAGADNSALAGAQRVRRSHSWAQDLAQTIGESNKAAQSPVYLRRNDANDAARDIVTIGGPILGRRGRCQQQQQG